MSDYPETDPFWVENRAKFLAEKSTSADPSACGTCRSNAAAGKPVVHDECQQRATLLHAPDHPYYEILAGFSLEENEKLPARFHVPVFDDCGVPNSWLCAVCQEEGQVVGWPCATATKYGTQVFTPLHEAETAQEKQAARIAALEDEIVRLRDQQAKDDDEYVQATAERDRYRLAWQSARERAQAYGEGILQAVKDRESYQQWLKQAEARVAELEAASRQWGERWQARCDHIAKQGLRWKAEAEGRKKHGEKLRAHVAELEVERHTTNEALSDAAETIRANRDRIAELEKVAVEARAALGALCYDLEDPGSNALGALYLLTQATVWTEAGPDDAADALAQHDAEVWRQAARLLEETGRDDDAVNLLDNVAAGIVSHATPAEQGAAS